MADKFLSSLVGGGGGLYQLAPELDRLGGASNAKFVVINAVGSLTTVINLTGKWMLTAGMFENVAAEIMTLKVTVDGIVIFNSTFTADNSAIAVIGCQLSFNTSINDTYIYCRESLLIELQTTSDSSVQFAYVARPIL